MYAEFFCPSCNGLREHTILKETSDLLVECKKCHRVHHVEKIKEPAEIEVKTIISIEGESKRGIIELDEDEIVRVGDLLVAETDGDAVGVEVTSIESGDKRLGKASAADIDTLWTRMIDKVILKVSYHDDRKTIPLYLEYEGEDDIVIGDVYHCGNYSFRVTHIKLRNSSMMRKEGWKAYARKIKRVYGIKSR
ncbi:MAG: hypothetical protein JXQ82_03715 [Methanomicrobiaceae archaeon]|nr:hypothetical protein [Methanomicrobiaceae archaeon]